MTKTARLGVELQSLGFFSAFIGRFCLCEMHKKRRRSCLREGKLHPHLSPPPPLPAKSYWREERRTYVRGHWLLTEERFLARYYITMFPMLSSATDSARELMFPHLHILACGFKFTPWSWAARDLLQELYYHVDISAADISWRSRMLEAHSSHIWVKIRSSIQASSIRISETWL